MPYGTPVALGSLSSVALSSTGIPNHRPVPARRETSGDHIQTNDPGRKTLWKRIFGLEKWEWFSYSALGTLVMFGVSNPEVIANQAINQAQLAKLGVDLASGALCCYLGVSTFGAFLVGEAVSYTYDAAKEAHFIRSVVDGATDDILIQETERPVGGFSLLDLLVFNGGNPLRNVTLMALSHDGGATLVPISEAVDIPTRGWHVFHNIPPLWLTPEYYDDYKLSLQFDLQGQGVKDFPRNTVDIRTMIGDIPSSLVTTVNIQSAPANTVSIVTTPSDYTDQGTGTTPFQRTYFKGTRINLAAPSAISNRRVFQCWRRNGIDYSTCNSISAVADSNATYTAIYKDASDPPSWVVTAASGEHGFVRPEGSVGVGKDGNLCFVASAGSGYSVDRWYLNGRVGQVGGDSFAVTNIQSNGAVLVTFRATVAGTIDVYSPVGNGGYSRGKTLDIYWKSLGTIGDRVRIELKNCDAGSTLVVTESAVNSGWYPWGIPDAAGDGAYVIWVTSTAVPAVQGVSGTFRIAGYTPSPTRSEIRTVEDLVAWSNLWGDNQHPWDGNYVLTNDIDASSTSSLNGGLGFKPLGSNAHYFCGTLDGNGHVIRNLTIKRPNESLGGLFSVIGDKGIVKNLTLEDSYISVLGDSGVMVGENAGQIINCAIISVTSNSVLRSPSDANTATGYLGGIAGDNTHTGRILNCCTSIQNINGQSDRVGGIAGTNEGAIYWCSSNCPWVRGHYYIGGIAGDNYGTIAECQGQSVVVGDYFVGGIAGFNRGTVINSFSSNSVKDCGYGGNRGGLVGDNEGNVCRCYSVATHNNSSGGGLIGQNFGWMSASFFDGQVMGIPNTQVCSPVLGNTGTVEDCSGLTTDQMKTADSFVAYGWDFDNVWFIASGTDYPQLRGVVPTLPPPENVFASAGRSDGVALSWDSHAAVHGIYRSDSETGERNCIQNWQPGLTFTDTTATPGVEYYYWVKGAATRGGAAESDFSHSVHGNRTVPKLTAVTSLKVSGDLSGVVLVEWNGVENANYYRVYRADSPSGVTVAVGDWQKTLSFVDSTAQPNVPYFYGVSAAIDSGGTRASDLGPLAAGSVNLPVLQVDPESSSVPASAGSVTLEIRNIGIGSMAWTAEIIDGADWLTIPSGDESGIDNQSVTICYIENHDSFTARTGRIRVSATTVGTLDDSQVVLVTQASQATPTPTIIPLPRPTPEPPLTPTPTPTSELAPTPTPVPTPTQGPTPTVTPTPTLALMPPTPVPTVALSPTPANGLTPSPTPDAAPTRGDAPPSTPTPETNLDPEPPKPGICGMAGTLIVLSLMLGYLLLAGGVQYAWE